MLVCFGHDPKDRYPARLLHESPKFDMAVLQVNRKFARPLVLASKASEKGDEIFACGYPGVVEEAMNKSFLTPTKVAELLQKVERTGYFQYFEFCSPDTFDSTLTKGIVSAPARHIGEATYLQMDAAISPGNSGGPVLNQQRAVVGIATLGLNEGSYNFALLIDQLRGELDYYLRDR